MEWFFEQFQLIVRPHYLGICEMGDEGLRDRVPGLTSARPL